MNRVLVFAAYEGGGGFVLETFQGGGGFELYAAKAEEDLYQKPSTGGGDAKLQDTTLAVLLFLKMEEDLC